MGTVNVSTFVVGTWVFASGCVGASRGSSSGIASGGGRDLPRATATNWFSVQVLLWSLSPRQNGAIRRSIYRDVRYASNGDESTTYHQLPYYALVIVFRASINPLCNQITTVHMLLTHASFPFLLTGDSFLLCLSNLPLLFSFSSSFKTCHIAFCVITARDAK